MSSEDQEKLIDYLDNGGALYIEGSNVAYDHQGTSFLSYLGVDFISIGSQNTISSLQGLSDTITQSLEFTYSYGSDADYNVDEIAGDVVILKSQDGKGRAVSYENRSYRTICASPILGAYHDGMDNNTKAYLVSLYLDYLTETITDSDLDVFPILTKLNQNYPNPFNPVTTISYNLKEDDFVSLAVFNLKGQKIIDLVDEKQNAGLHMITWKGTDNNGINVSSGIYLYKLKTDDASFIRKMLMVK